jgi:serine/threonine protein kinase/Tfp pilus assembly protein PilF
MGMAAAESPSTCTSCGAETRDGFGCLACLLRLGFDETLNDVNGAAALQPLPDQFGHYTIASHPDGSAWELGRGAMGVTFRALDTSLERPVALKLLHTEVPTRGAGARERFMREARVAAALRHPNVATVYHFGIREETGQCFYAMELVEGETLEERVRRTGPLDPQTTIAIAQQAAAALAAAEKRGLVHRDLKPANLMLVAPDEERAATNRNGECEGLVVKVIDFGLAKAIERQGDPMSLTHGGFVGTPAFASPEQFSDAPLDVRSDIYSLGVTLWFALTGKTPFSGGSVEEIKQAQRSGDLPIERLKAAGVRPRLAALLQSMLSLEPASRPGTQDLVVRLGRCHAQANGWTKSARFALAAALMLGLAAIGFFALRSSRSQDRHELQSTPGPASAASGTSSLAAREAYQMGIFIWDARRQQRFPEAEKYFRRAVALDPNYAQAYAGLADVLQFIAWDPQLRRQAYTEAEAAARRALEINPDLAEAHAALGLIAMNYNWDWPLAEREFRRSIELNPEYATGHHWYAEYLGIQGRFEESLPEIERARQLNPTLPIMQHDVGKILFYARRFDESEAQFKKALTLDPDLWGAHFWLAQIYAYKKQFPQAFAELQELQRIAPAHPVTYAAAVYVYSLAGDRAQAEQMLTQTLARLSSQVDNLAPIYAYLGLGDKERALSYLERDYEAHATTAASLAVEPIYDSLRSDPRFADLMRRVHLAP